MLIVLSSLLVSAGVIVKLCLPGILGLCSALQPVSPPGLQHLYSVDMCHHCMQNVVPAEVYKPSFLLQELLHGEYDQNLLFDFVHNIT